MIPSPIFILGTQRSGTTLLTRVLSAHSKVFIQNELNIDEVFLPKGSKAEVTARIDSKIEKIHGHSVKNLLAKDNKDTWGVKDPQFTEHVDSLRQFLPESKFIIIIRDARGVVNSYMDNKWGLGTNAYTGALRWVKEVQIQKKFMAEAPDNFILIRFEDLIADMEGTLVKVCDHIGVEFDPGMLAYSSSGAQFKINRQNVNTNKSPDKKIAEKWVSELSASEIDVIETTVRDELLVNGYQLIGKQVELSVFRVLFYKIHQLIIGEIQIQYQLKKYKIKLYWDRFFTKNAA